jgi:hypothetical protein
MGKPTMTADLLTPLLVMGVAYMALFFTLWIVSIHAEIRQRRANALALKAAGRA